MAGSAERVGEPTGVIARLMVILNMIRFEHTVFALPFALLGALFGAQHAGLPRGLPTALQTWWILVAMAGARSAAMAFNRIVDARYDAMNPRTATRAIPAGLLSVSQVAVFLLASVAAFLVAAWQLNPLCLALSPIALAAVLGYSFTKRFTSLSHLALGVADGIAPIGAWVAVTGSLHPASAMLGLAVTLWIGGFDVIYALQDVEFDRRVGLHSLPSRIGAGPALLVSRVMHAATIVVLVAVGQMLGLHTLYYIGVAVAAALITWEQTMVSPTDLSRVNLAFFTLNGWVSVSLFAFALLDRLVAR